jgi:hypothetical protein
MDDIQVAYSRVVKLANWLTAISLISVLFIGTSVHGTLFIVSRIGVAIKLSIFLFFVLTGCALLFLLVLRRRRYPDTSGSMASWISQNSLKWFGIKSGEHLIVLMFACFGYYWSNAVDILARFLGGEVIQASGAVTWANYAFLAGFRNAFSYRWDWRGTLCL